MSWKRWLIVLVSFGAAIGVSVWIARSSWPADPIPVHVPLWAHLVAVAAVAGELLARSVKIRWSADSLHIPLRLSTALRVCLGGDFGAAITPARSGAEPARFLVLAEAGVTAANALLILFTELFLEMLSLVAIAVVLAFAFQGSGAVLGGIAGMIGGWAAVVLGAGAFGLVLSRRNANGPPPPWARRIGLHAGRWRAVQRALRQLRTSIDGLRHARVDRMVLALLASIVHVLCRLTILPVLVYALGGASAPLSNLVLWPLAILYGGSVAPAPAGGGFVEGMFKVVLDGTIPAPIFGASLIWWRFYTFYLYILLGAVATGSVVMRAMREKERIRREEEDAQFPDGDGDGDVAAASPRPAR